MPLLTLRGVADGFVGK